MKDLYKILQVNSNATPTDIRKNYLKLARESHPDKFPGREEQFKEINSANEILSDHDKRREYDRAYQLYLNEHKDSFQRVDETLRRSAAAATASPKQPEKPTDDANQCLYAEKRAFFIPETQEVFDDLVKKQPLWKNFVISLSEDAIAYLNNPYFMRLHTIILGNASMQSEINERLKNFNAIRKCIDMRSWEHITQAMLLLPPRLLSYYEIKSAFSSISPDVLKEIAWPKFYDRIKESNELFRAADINYALQMLAKFNKETITLIFSSPDCQMAIDTELFPFMYLLTVSENLLKTMDQNYVEAGLLLTKYFSGNKRFRYCSDISSYDIYNRENPVLSYLLYQVSHICWKHASSLIQIDPYRSNDGLNSIRLSQCLGIDGFIDRLLHIARKDDHIVFLKQQLEQEQQSLWASNDPISATKNYTDHVKNFTKIALETEPDNSTLKFISFSLDKLELLIQEIEQWQHDNEMNHVLRP